MSGSFPLAIYRYQRMDGGVVLVPLMKMDEETARKKRFELMENFYLSAMECSVAYNTAMKLRWTLDEKGLLSRLNEMLH